MSVAFPTLHIQACHLFTPILPSPSMTVYMSVYPYLSLSLYPRHDCSLLHKEPGSDTLHTKQLTQFSSCIIKIREMERERRGQKYTSNKLCFSLLNQRNSSWNVRLCLSTALELILLMKAENDLLCFYQMIKARVEILNLSVAYSAIQSFSHLYTCCTTTVYFLLNDLSAMAHTAEANNKIRNNNINNVHVYSDPRFSIRGP